MIENKTNKHIRMSITLLGADFSPLSTASVVYTLEEVKDFIAANFLMGNDAVELTEKILNPFGETIKKEIGIDG